MKEQFYKFETAKDMLDWKTAYHLAFRTKMISEWLYVFANIELKYWIPILNEGWLFKKKEVKICIIMTISSFFLQ